MNLEYEELVKKAYDSDAQVVEMDFDSDTKGLCIGKCIVLSKKLENSAEKCCILAEELGHYYMTVGDITKNLHIDDRKQERTARGYAFRLLAGIEKFVEAWENGCRSLADTAEYLCVTPKFAADAIDYYREKYGESTTCGDCTVYFVPVFDIQKNSSTEQ